MYWESLYIYLIFIFPSYQGAAFGLFHDVMVTENFYIVIENSIRLDVVQLLTGYVPKRASFAQCLQYRPDIPCKMHLIPRDPAAPVESYTLPNSFFCFHHWYGKRFFLFYVSVLSSQPCPHTHTHPKKQNL